MFDFIFFFFWFFCFFVFFVFFCFSDLSYENEDSRDPELRLPSGLPPLHMSQLSLGSEAASLPPHGALLRDSLHLFEKIKDYFDVINSNNVDLRNNSTHNSPHKKKQQYTHNDGNNNSHNSGSNNEIERLKDEIQSELIPLINGIREVFAFSPTVRPYSTRPGVF